MADADADDGQQPGLERVPTVIYTGLPGTETETEKQPPLNRSEAFYGKSISDSKDKRQFYQKGAFGYIILIALYIVVCIVNILYLFSVMSENAVKIISTVAYAAAAFAYAIILYKHTKKSAEQTSDKRTSTRRGSVPPMFTE